MVTLDEIYARLRSFEEKNKEQMFEIERRLTRLESGASGSGDNERLGDLEDLLRMNELELIKLNERIGAGADATAIIPTDVKDRLDDLEKKVSFAPAGAEGALPSELNAKLEAVEERVNDIENVSKDKLEEMTVKLNETMNRVRDAGPTSVANLGKKVEELKQIEARLDNELDNRRGVVNKLGSIDGEVEKINAAMSSARAIEEKIKNDIELLNTTKDEISRKADSTMARMRTLEEDVEQRMANAESKINSGLDKVTHAQETIDTQMTRLDRKFALIDKGGLSEEVLTNMNKKASEYQYKINQLSEQLQGLDVAKIERKMDDLSERILNAEKRSDERSIKFLTDQLDQFAKIVDNKIPQLPSHGQFDNIMRRIEQIDNKIMHIQRPNILPLEDQVNDLANKVDNVISVIQRTNERMNKRIGRAFPVIVD